MVAVFLNDNRQVAISIVVAVLLNDDRLVAISIMVAVFLNDNRLIAVAIPLIMARPDCYANRPNTDPTSSAPAGIALQIPSTAAITYATRVVILLCYNYYAPRSKLHQWRIVPAGCNVREPT